MKKGLLLLVLLFLAGMQASVAQNFNEWFRQKKTQRKYLLEQIAKLQLHIEHVRKGYQIVREGLNLVSQIKEGDFAIHHLFFSDLDKVKPVIRQSPRFVATYKLYLDNKQQCNKLLNDLNTYAYLSATFKSMIIDYGEATLIRLEKEFQLLKAVSSDAGFQMSDDERFKRIDVLYGSFSNTKKTLQVDHENISLYNYRRGQSIRMYDRLLNQQ